MKSSRYSIGIFASLLLAGWSAHAAPLTAGEPVLLEKTQGRFDFIRVDADSRRLFLGHTGNKSLDIFDLDSKRLVKSVHTGAAQDSAVDAKGGLYFASVSAPPQMAIVDANKLEVTGNVALSAPADLMLFNPENGMAYVCNDDDPEIWVIDPQPKKIVSTIALPGKGMEGILLSPDRKHIYQAMKEANGVAVIDLSNNKVANTMPTAPATAPHGMDLVPDSDFLLVAGGNGKLVLLNRASSQVTSSASIAPKVDEIAYDAGMHRVYCASGQGKISVVSLEDGKLTSIGDVADASGCHSIAVDPKTHTVWIAYAKGEQSFVQPFNPGK